MPVEEPKPAPIPDDIKLLTEIRDSLKELKLSNSKLEDVSKIENK